MSEQTAKKISLDIAENPKTLERPLVILSGYLDPLSARFLKRKFTRAFQDDRIIQVSFFFQGSNIKRARNKLVAAIDKAFPSNNSHWTTEVDIVAVSMGGLVARYAAAPVVGKRRVKINRLFTLSTPHLGANVAAIPVIGNLLYDMHAESKFMQELNQLSTHRDYQIIPYTRLGDYIVGAENTAPKGEKPWWVSSKGHLFTHAGVFLDSRIIVDIMLRLRNEHPFTSISRADLP